jgi:hypothetical protein
VEELAEVADAPGGTACRGPRTSFGVRHERDARAVWLRGSAVSRAASRCLSQGGLPPGYSPLLITPRSTWALEHRLTVGYKNLMKRALLPALLGVALATLVSAGNSPQEIYTEAQRAFLRGDRETARMKFSQLLEMDPKDIRARNSLRLIEQQDKADGGAATVQRRLERMRIPKLEFRDATLDSALEYLRQQAEKLSGGETKLNFVVKLPPEQQAKTITLSLSDIPVTEAIKYVADLADVSVEYQAHAVMIKPRGATAAPQP